MTTICVDCNKSIGSRSVRCYSCNAKAQWAAKNSTLRSGVKRGWELGHYDHVVTTSITKEALAKQSASMKRKWAEDTEYAELVARRRMEELIKPEVRARISDGVKRSWDNPARRERSLRGLKGDTLRRSKLEYKIAAVLDGLGIIYKSQFILRGLNRFYDFYLPELQVLLEVDGEYWHHSAWAICAGQELIDEEKNAWALTSGYSIIRLRECYLIQYGAESMVNSALTKFQTCLKRPVGLKYVGETSGPML